ncbi:outer membrane-specific lipoprotein transporter subunit LolE [compost metagenome]
MNTADDRAVFTTLDAAWAVHHNEKADHQEVTALLIKPKTLLGAQTVKLQYEKLDNIQAVYSSKVVADVVNMIDKGSQLLSVVTILCILLAAITIVLSLVAAINERKKDVGLLRLIGKSKAFVWGSFIGEGFIITSVGLVLGIIIGHAAGLLGSDVIFDFTGIRMNAMVFQKQEMYLILGALVVGIAASAGPAFRIYKVEPLELFRS